MATRWDNLRTGFGAPAAQTAVGFGAAEAAAHEGCGGMQPSGIFICVSLGCSLVVPAGKGRYCANHRMVEEEAMAFTAATAFEAAAAPFGGAAGGSQKTKKTVPKWELDDQTGNLMIDGELVAGVGVAVAAGGDNPNKSPPAATAPTSALFASPATASMVLVLQRFEECYWIPRLLRCVNARVRVMSNSTCPTDVHSLTSPPSNVGAVLKARQLQQQAAQQRLLEKSRQILVLC